MGCGASVPEKQTESKEGPSSPKQPQHAPVVTRSMRSVSTDEDAMFGNYVIDTSSLRFSTTEMSTPDIDGSSAKRYAKSDAVRQLISVALKGNFIFESLTRHELENLIDVFSPISCVSGDEIIKQGAVGDFMYVIESGKFEVTKRGHGKLTECGVGQTFGELALLYGAKRSATVTCIQDASLWALDRQTFRQYRASNQRMVKDLALEVLAKVPLLKDLQLAQLSKAAEVYRTVDYEEGDVIVRKGEVGHTFFIVLEGIVNCSDARLVDDGQSSPTPIEKGRAAQGLPVASLEGDGLTPREMTRQASLPTGGVRLKAGDWFGEVALLNGSKRTANVIADSSVRLLAFDRTAFEKVLGSLTDILDRKANNRMLSVLPVIANLPPKRREAAVDMFSIENYSNADTIATAGDPNPRFILVKSGCILVHRPPMSKIPTPTHVQPKDPLDFPTSLPNLNPNPARRSSNPTTPKGGTRMGKSPRVFPSSLVEEATSGTVRSGSRAVQDSFESSFESLSSFEMVMTPGKSFGDTSSGSGNRKERRIEKKGKNAQPTIGEDEDEGHLSSSDFVKLKEGEHVGAECMMNGSPMDCTVIARGDVTCFVLTRDDLGVLLADDDEDTASIESKIKKLTHRGSAKIHVEEQVEEVDWASLKNLGKIGAGTFGTVLMMQDTRDKAAYAMKVLDKKKVKKMRQERRLETEKQLLRTMQSPFICRFFGDIEDDAAFYLLLELVQGGELQRLIHPQDPEKRSKQQQVVESGLLAGIPHQPAKFYAAAISLPLVYIHRRVVAFRDLKPENVMIDRFGYPKLIDFGLAKPLEPTGGKTYTLCGTPEYLAPEVILGTGHNQAVDWWALGVLLFEMVVGSSPFLQKGVDRRKQDHMVIFENIVEGRVEYPVDMESGCKDLVKRLLNGKPAIRMCSGRKAHKEFEEHLWFSGVVDWNLLNLRQITPPWFPPIQTSTDQVCFGKAPRPESTKEK